MKSSTEATACNNKFGCPYGKNQNRDEQAGAEKKPRFRQVTLKYCPEGAEQNIYLC